MRIKQISLAASIALAAGIATSVPAQAATATAVPLPLAHYSHMLVDPAHQHLFFSEGSGYSTILVTDFSGNTVATLGNEPGATGLALSPDGSTVYAALANGDAVSAISTGTLAETARYATGTGTAPQYVAATGGRIWFGYGPASQGAIGSIDPGASPAAVTLSAAPGYWASAPMLTASPSGELVAGEPQQSPIELAAYNVSSGTATVLAPQTSEPGDNLAAFQLTPDSSELVIAGWGATPYAGAQRLSAATLSVTGEYGTSSGPDSVAISGDGTVATGDTGDNVVSVYAPDSDTLLHYESFAGGEILAQDGLAFAPDGSTLFAVTGPDNSGSSPTLNIVPNPEQTAANLSATAPATAKQKQSFTVSGKLSGLAPYTGGQTLHVTRNGTALPDATTGADGSFSFTDTAQTKGTYTYQVSYAGDVHLTAATASAAVTVG